jgi:hypothetical protein
MSGFECFLSDMKERPSPEHSLDRWPNNETGNYEPTNCRWATEEEQSNNRRDNIILGFDSDMLSAALTRAQWSRKLGWPIHKLRNHLRSIDRLRSRLKDAGTVWSSELPEPLASAWEALMQDLEGAETEARNTDAHETYEAICQRIENERRAFMRGRRADDLAEAALALGRGEPGAANRIVLISRSIEWIAKDRLELTRGSASTVLPEAISTLGCRSIRHHRETVND